MEDLEETRRWLGYEKINIYGTSYGTMAAFVYAKKYPANLRAMVLKGVAPPTERIAVTTAQDVQRSLEMLFHDCEADAACASAFPDLRGEYRSLLEKLEKGPFPTKILNPETKELEEAHYSRQALGIALRAILHAPSPSANVPMMIHEAYKGNFTPLAIVNLEFLKGAQSAISFGMFLTIYCSEEIPFVDFTKIEEQTAGTPHGDTWVRPIQRACTVWPQGTAMQGLTEPLKSDLPVLLISGVLDPVTPDIRAAEAAKHLPNSYQLNIKKGGHSFNLMSGCVENIITKFVQQASIQGIDISCIEKIQRPPFLTKTNE
jgi:pimeloyl-ACP methyl ester carboxylesterase